MNQHEVIADKIEEAINRMFRLFSEFEPKASEYSLYFNPKLHESWFIEIYFSDSQELKIALKGGTCYQIHTYLQEEFEGIEELENVGRSISFEYGNRPSNNKEYHNRHVLLVERIERMYAAEGQAEIKICNHCGHDFDEHQLMYFVEDENEAPTEGWMVCPEENCNCFLTWGANYKEVEK